MKDTTDSTRSSLCVIWQNFACARSKPFSEIVRAVVEKEDSLNTSVNLTRRPSSGTWWGRMPRDTSLRILPDSSFARCDWEWIEMVQIELPSD